MYQQLLMPFLESETVASLRRAERIWRKLNQIREELNQLYASAPAERPQITCPQDAADLLLPFLSGLDHEELWVVPLDTHHRVLKLHKLYQGTLNASHVRIAEIFRVAILNNAAALIIAHNHPSGDPNPSPDDISITRQTMEVGRLFDVELLDHLIIGNGRWVSLKECGVSV
ncbi:DNA repair proteins [Anaerolinea thermolimosa]|uniref:JAB domain-containing protein n=1 Tax=Anaerolinea thermolimosa TaxID=229919 RepID=UPI0007829CD2|nr:JAB domain-containing protein [Anaerolinea thermolimosa]GAP06122.1 DNA repair proteins [Anaerolinea thermolimosa]